MPAFPPPPFLPGRRATLAGAAGLLAACATGVPPQAVAGLHRLSVVTAFDPRLTLRFYGFTVLDNERAEGTLDMGLGPAAADAVKAALASRFEIAAVEHRPNLLADRQRAQGGSDLPEAAMAEALRPLAPGLAGDAVLLLVTSWGEVPLTAAGSGRTRWYGAGLTQYSRTPDPRYNNAWARVAWRMVLFKLPELRMLGRQDAWAPGDKIGAPSQQLGFRWAYADGAVLPPAQAAELIQAARAAVAESVPETLGWLGLVPRAR